MADNREVHNSKGVQVITGGVKEFYYSREKLSEIENTDTESTRAFKKALLIRTFFNTPEEEIKKRLLRYARFYKVRIKVFDKKERPVNKFEVDISYAFRPSRFEKVLLYKFRSGIAQFSLPEGKYTIACTRKILFFFTKRTKRTIELRQDLDYVARL